MAGFRRGGTDVDEALPFLTTEDAAHLRRLVADEFRAAGHGVTVHDDHVAGDDGWTYGLWNVAALCHDADAHEEWPAIVGHHVRTLLHRPPGPDEMTDDELLERAVLRLVPDDQLVPGVRDGFRYAVPVADGLRQVLAADFPDSVVTLRDEDVERVGFDRLHAAGRARLLAEPVEHGTAHVEGGARLEVFGGESVYVASRLLVLEDLLRTLPGGGEHPDGVLVAVPDRQTLVVHVPVDGGVLGALQAMAGATAHAWATAPGGVSPRVYWWRDGTLTPVTRLEGDERVIVEIQPDLGAVLDRLAAR